MTGNLRCYSFHSVKGGVGKSALATLCAMRLASTRRTPVYLVDVDLTGTSIADVLPLKARRPLVAGQTPDDPFYSLEDTRVKIDKRGELRPDQIRDHEIRFLNDFLLYATPDWDARTEMPVASLEWVLEGGPKNLFVIPSSALPVDLMRIVPVIFDEEHSAFLESRLEYLLAELVPPDGDASVVIDTPPTIPGLSRAVLSLALRLTRETKVQLSEDAGMPRVLEMAGVDWRACMVATLDHQDIRAIERWLHLLTEDEEDVVRVVLNRAPPAGVGERKEILENILTFGSEHILHNLFSDPIWFEDISGLDLFRTGYAPPNLEVVDIVLESK